MQQYAQQQMLNQMARYPQQQQAQGQPNFSQFTPQQIAQMQQMQQIQAAQAAQQAAQQQQQQRPAYSSNASQQAVPQQQMPLASKKTAQIPTGDGDTAYRNARKRNKPSDRNLPPFTSESSLTADSDAALATLASSYAQLVSMEKKLDANVSRKKLELMEMSGKTGSHAAALGTTGGKMGKIKRKLRVCVWNECEAMDWQDEAKKEGEEPKEPKWTLKISGKLVDPEDSQKLDDSRKFTSLVNSIAVEIQPGEGAPSQDSDRTEWTRPIGSAPLDGLTLTQSSSTSKTCQIQIQLQLSHYPERSKLSPDLSSILGITEDSKAGILTALWTYIRKHGLQDLENRQNIKTDEALKKIMNNQPLVPVYALTEFIARAVQKPDPVNLDYTVRTDVSGEGTAQVWDIDIDVEDTPLKAKMEDALDDLTSSNLTREILDMDEQIASKAAAARSTKNKRDFMCAFAEDPKEFISNWLQQTDADALATGERTSAQMSGPIEDIRRADFYRKDDGNWLRDAVNVAFR